MNDEDELIVADTFRQMDFEIHEALEAVARKYFKKIEKQTFYEMGYRQRAPVSEQERYEDFKEFLCDVYIRPSI